MPPRPGSAAAEETLTLLDGGWSLGDALVFYEAYYRRGELARIAERIDQGDYGRRRTDYYFSGDQLERVISDGWERDAGDWQLHHRQFWLSFNGAHFAQGQQRLDERPERLSSDLIALVREEAQLLLEQLQQMQDNGERLWRGQWNGERFTPCGQGAGGEVYSDGWLPGSYEILAGSDDWDWLSSFSERLSLQGESHWALLFLGLQQPRQGKIEMTQLMSLQPAEAGACERLAPLRWKPQPAE